MAAELDNAIEMIDLADVRDDESWPTDPEKVDSFARHLEQGKQFSSLLVRRVWHEDGSVHYEIIDGFHRFRAMQRAGIKQHVVTAVEVDERTADYDRAQASLDKPSQILHRRAIQAIQRGFARDMLGHLPEQGLLERYMDEVGEVHIRTSEKLAPTDPMDALLAVIEHERALELRTYRENQGPASERKGKPLPEDWQPLYQHWLDEMCAWFGVTRTWLTRDALGLHLLELDDVGSQSNRDRQNAFAAALWLPDPDIRRAFIKRMAKEHVDTPVLQMAVQQLGMDLFFVQHRKMYPTATRGKSAILRELAAHGIRDLAAQWQQRTRSSRPSAAAVTDAQPQRTEEVSPVTDAVFATVSPSFADTGHDEHVENWIHARVMLRDAIREVKRCGKLYEDRGGDWGMFDVQQSLQSLADWLGPRLRPTE